MTHLPTLNPYTMAPFDPPRKTYFERRSLTPNSNRWIAKLVAKVTKKLETAQGDVGYSGNIPVALEPYRLPEGHVELSKILA